MENYFNRTLTALLTVAAVGFSTSASAGEDLEGAGDHPEVPRMAGSYIVHHELRDYERLVVPTGPYHDGELESSKTREGEVTYLSYVFEDDETTTLRIKRSYLQVLEERDFEILFSASEEALSSGDGRLFLVQSTNNFQRGARECCHLSNRDRQVRYIAARSADGATLASIAIYNARRVGPTVAKAIVTSSEMEYDMEHRPLSLDEMEEGLIQDGRVAIQDILFEFDSNRILADSEDALKTIVDLMADQPGMKLLVVGHTDSVGDYDYNLQLSMARAQAVVQWLTEQGGVASDRLQSAGAGMMAPITTNRSEEGRAQNRRVELVELSADSS